MYKYNLQLIITHSEYEKTFTTSFFKCINKYFFNFYTLLHFKLLVNLIEIHKLNVYYLLIYNLKKFYFQTIL